MIKKHQSLDHRFAVVLPSAGYTGAYQVGLLEYLTRYGLHWNDETINCPQIDIAAGTGTGALNAAFAAANKLTLLGDLWCCTHQMHSQESLGNLLDWIIPSTSVLDKLYEKTPADRLQEVCKTTTLLLNYFCKYLQKSDFEQTDLLLNFYNASRKTNQQLRPRHFENSVDVIDAILTATRSPLYHGQLEMHNGFAARKLKVKGVAIDTPVGLIESVISQIRSRRENHQVYHLVIAAPDCSTAMLTPDQLARLSDHISGRKSNTRTGQKLTDQPYRHYLSAHSLLSNDMCREILSLHRRELLEEGIVVHVIPPIHKTTGLLDKSVTKLKEHRSIGYASMKKYNSYGDRHAMPAV